MKKTEEVSKNELIKAEREREFLSKTIPNWVLYGHMTVTELIWVCIEKTIVEL